MLPNTDRADAPAQGGVIDITSICAREHPDILVGRSHCDEI
jgi:hypothetical protein